MITSDAELISIVQTGSQFGNTKSIHKQHSGVHQRVEQFQMVSEQQPPPIHSGGSSPIDDGNYMETVKNNRDVEILNHCIDEIENFVLELKSINEARKRLSKKKRSRKKKDKEILENSAKSPSEDKLTDIFQKFKHCFNLLAKLKHHISNPNSPELVHYLMIPLTIISKVTSVDMVRSIQSPLLTAGAIEMLGNCLDSHENEYWKSLGSNWTLPKTAPCFKEKYLTTYIPVFTDGWVAPEIITDERGEAAAKSTAVMVAKMKIVEEDEVKQGREVSTHNEPTEVARIPAAPGGKIALVVYDYWAHNNKELTIRAGQKVHVLDDSRRWWLVRNDHSEQGYVPSTVLEFPREDSSDSSSMDGSISPGSSASNTAKLGSIKSPYSPAFPPEVIDKLQNEASKESKTVVTETPTREVVKVTRETVVVENTFVFNEEESQQTAVESVPVESFPPPPEFPEVQESVSSSTPPIPPPYVATEIHQVVLKTTPPPVKAKPAKTEELESPQQDFQAELAARLQTTPTTTTIQDDVDFFIPLFKSSTADDVSRWLRKLGFNESVLEKLQGTEAKKLFQMSRKDLIEKLGDEESAIVLHDELQVQIGAQTRHKTMTEFQRALVQRINRQGTQKIAPSSSLAPPRAADVPSSQVTQVTNTELKTTIVTNTNSKMTQEEMQKLFEEQQQLIKSQQEQLSHLKEQGDTANNNVEALTAL